MKVLVCGGRNYQDRSYLFKTMDDEHAVRGFTHVIHGAYKGADMLADEWALARGVQPVRCPANWKYDGAAAGPNRNRLMLALNPEYFLAFPGGRGTGDMVSKLVNAGVAGRQILR